MQQVRLMACRERYAHAATCGHMAKATSLRATIVKLLQQVESRTCRLLWFDGEEIKEKEPIMTRILKKIAALGLVVGTLIGGVGTSDAQKYRYYNNPYGQGPAYHGAYRSHRAMAPKPSQRGYYTNSLT